MKCLMCSINIPEMPENATLEEKLCDRCFEIADMFDTIITLEEKK